MQRAPARQTPRCGPPTAGARHLGSDWPVCLLAASYDRVLAVAHETMQGLSDAEGTAVFGGNATDLYRLR